VSDKPPRFDVPDRVRKGVSPEAPRVITLAALALIVVLSLAGPAAAETTNTRVPLSFGPVPTCAGEFVTIEGVLHIVTSEEVDGAGGVHVLGLPPSRGRARPQAARSTSLSGRARLPRKLGRGAARRLRIPSRAC
jgi:hypothetical protein